MRKERDEREKSFFNITTRKHRRSGKLEQGATPSVASSFQIQQSHSIYARHSQNYKKAFHTGCEWSRRELWTSISEARRIKFGGEKLLIIIFMIAISNSRMEWKAAVGVSRAADIPSSIHRTRLARALMTIGVVVGRLWIRNHGNFPSTLGQLDGLATFRTENLGENEANQLLKQWPTASSSTWKGIAKVSVIFGGFLCWGFFSSLQSKLGERNEQKCFVVGVSVVSVYADEVGGENKFVIHERFPRQNWRRNENAFQLISGPFQVFLKAGQRVDNCPARSSLNQANHQAYASQPRDHGSRSKTNKTEKLSCQRLQPSRSSFSLVIITRDRSKPMPNVVLITLGLV